MVSFADNAIALTNKHTVGQFNALPDIISLVARLPFDPERAAGAESLPKSAERSELGPSGRQRKRIVNGSDANQLTVSQVNELIKTTLEQRLPSPLRVIGQMSNLSVKNHWYFSLKDETSVLSCVAWAADVRKFGFTPKDGDEVIAAGHISHYSPQGRTQLYVTGLMPVGAGALELRFRALCEELRKLGYFDEERKKLLPIFPRRIAVITSSTGAAIHDVITTAAQRCKAIGLVLVDVRVQGEGAAEDVAKAIKWVDRSRTRLGVDAILVTRGGGSIEDLWAFNERIVADAVFKCTLPVVAAIGHESDTTIIELVADVRASTPTQAAMRLIPSSKELSRHIGHVVHRLGLMTRRIVERQRHLREKLAADLRRIILFRIADERTRLERLATRMAKLQPQAQLAQRQFRVASLVDRLHRATARRVSIDERDRLVRLHSALHDNAKRHVRQSRQNLAILERELTAIDPEGVLRRGYSLTMHSDGRLIRSVRDVQRGEQMATRLTDGTVDSVVGGASPAGALKKSSQRKSSRSPREQMDLFGT